MTTAETVSPAVTVTAEQATALMRLHGRMPFGASLTEPWDVGQYVGTRTLNPDKLVSWLEELSGRLEAHGQEHQRVVTELAELQSQRDAVRAFLGTTTR